MRALQICLLVVFLALVGCSAEDPGYLPPLGSYSQSTQDPAQIYTDGIQAQHIVEAGQATLSAVSSHLTATAAAIRATATARAQERTATAEAIALDQAATATERAFAANQATAAAEGTATQQAWLAGQKRLDDQATSTAISMATIQTAELSWTQAAIDRQATADVAAIQSVATQQAIVAQSNELALERERTMNTVRAVAPWAGMGLVAALLVWLAIRFGRKELHRPSEVRRDERGYPPLLVDENGTVYNDAKNPRPVYQPLLPSGPAIPQLVDATTQSEQTRAANTIEFMHDGLAGRHVPTPEPFMPGFTAAPASSTGSNLVEVVPATAKEIKDLLPDVLPAIYTNAIDDDVIEKGG